ncbi:Uncharacterised protein [Candidatus Bilamarchaeum dharawalense]|uniref:Kazal-like domain-containing protein n=1 Tax=Candidatus Bilamarchaeum dharawalense TaxID=2885759 RepID=A0A5E4LMI3_9ARCH|nr:Uncharacterised protein [Candidatus Bilamarchaeum dharawalense]
MRIHYLLLLLGLLFVFGCTNPPPVDNQTNNTNDTIVIPKNCTGPVCGVDGQTYNTDCDAENENVEIAYKKACLVVENCIDSDGGNNKNMIGTVTKGSESFTDYCMDSNQLAEYYCADSNISLVGIPCGLGNICMNGACIVDPNYHENITPVSACVGPSEVDISTAYTTTFANRTNKDTCMSYDLVKKYYCKNDKLESINIQCNPGYYCNLGRCELRQYSCSENDGGKNISSTGKTTALLGIMVISENFDECVDTSTLTEYYCLPNNTATSENIDCGTGFKCFDGRCVKSACNDSDGGFNIYKVGTAKGKDKLEHTDVCQDKKTIIEYYCIADDTTYQKLQCGVDYFCDVDHCVEGSTP